MPRKKGILNRATVERQREAARAIRAAEQGNPASVDPLDTGPMPKETLLKLHRYFMGMTAKYAETGPQPDEKKFLKFAALAMDAASKAAPYYHARLASIEHRGEQYDLRRLSDDQLSQLEAIIRAASATSVVDGRGPDRAETTRH